MPCNVQQTAACQTARTRVSSDATLTPLDRVVVCVVGALAGACTGVGTSTPGRGSVSGIWILLEPPNSEASQLPER